MTGVKDDDGAVDEPVGADKSLDERNVERLAEGERVGDGQHGIVERVGRL